jgi:carbamoyltransferase
MTLTLGIHIGHDGGAAICDGDEIVVACSEERLSRQKYANGWWLSVRYCLESSGLCLDDIDAIIFSNSGEPLAAGFDGGLLRWTSKSLRISTVDHHTSHAVGAYCFSPFDSGLVFVGDAGGNYDNTESAFLFDRTGWQQVLRSPQGRPRSKGLGTTYEAFTNFLGFSDQESGKTMALAAYGDSAFGHQVELFHVSGHGEITSQLQDTHYWGVADFSRRQHDFLKHTFPSSTSPAAKNVAAYIQREFEQALVAAVRTLGAAHGAQELIVTGGIALNCLANQQMSELAGAANFYAFPACSDCGLAIGNALFGIWEMEGILPKPSDRSFRFGRTYDDADIKRALERHPDTVPPGEMRHGNVHWTRSSNRYADAVDLINDGKVVAWWQGKSETGPRALGGRSIIGDASAEGIRDKLNAKVKHREWFRPLAPSVRGGELATLIGRSASSSYMNMAPQVIETARHYISECVHIDGSARVQSVDEINGPEFFQLLSEKAKRGSFPAVLNTSFNVREPIVETPGDAIATFLRSSLDALVLEDYIVTRRF